jgi:hypothetical protein
MRTTGFLLGALLMLAAFLLALSAGIDPAPLQERVSSKPVAAAADTRPAEELPVESALDEGVAMAADSASPAGKPLPDGNGGGLKLTPQSWNQAMGAYEAVLRNDSAKASRFQVWSPFHSQWAAQGFARRLTQATEVPMEVVTEGPGNYQVVFSYRDDGERQAMVRQIEAVTGLELE